MIRTFGCYVALLLVAALGGCRSCGARKRVAAPAPTPPPATAAIIEPGDCGNEQDAQFVMGVPIIGRNINRCEFSWAPQTAAFALSTVEKEQILRSDEYWATGDCTARRLAIANERGPPDWQDCRRIVWRGSGAVPTYLEFNAENGCLVSSMSPDLLGTTGTEWPWGTAVPTTPLRDAGGAAWSILAEHTAPGQPVVWGGHGRSWENAGHADLSRAQLSDPAIAAARSLGQPTFGTVYFTTPPFTWVFYAPSIQKPSTGTGRFAGLLAVGQEPLGQAASAAYFAACAGVISAYGDALKTTLRLEPFWLP